MAQHKIQSGLDFFFYPLVFDRLHDAMHLSKMSRTSCIKIGNLSFFKGFLTPRLKCFLQFSSCGP